MTDNARVLPEPVIAPLIEGVYRALLGREPDRSGLTDFSALLRSGPVNQTVAAMLSGVLSSPEYLARSSGEEDRTEVNELVVAATGSIVQRGPFEGMRMVARSMRGDGDIAPKLLGTYEQEIHVAIEGLARNRYDAIVDIGCAEGYYAVGLARRFEGVPVLAYDTDQGALDILRELAVTNGCGDRIETRDFCDPQTLRALYDRYPRLLVVADCEGYERTLFCDPSINAGAGGADLIIECHDLWDAGVTEAICSALDPTHEIETIRSGGRDPNAYPFFLGLSEWGRWRAVWERRGGIQNWLVCHGRGRQGRG